MENIVNLLKRYGPLRFVKFSVSELYAWVWKRGVFHSFSQNNEDIILDKLTGHKQRGFYVDVGAYDPYRFSNTMRFYKRGWRGLNIEPDIDRLKLFLRARRRDINLNIGIAKKKGSLMYFSMDPPTLSTFVQKQALEDVKRGFSLIQRKKISVLPLKIVLEKYIGRTKIDFLSLDVEGFEMDVLKSNDWKRYRPRFLCIETAVEEGADSQTLPKKHIISNYLGRQGYTMLLDNGLNSFYKDNQHG